jgi:hypothetical protein
MNFYKILRGRHYQNANKENSAGHTRKTVMNTATGKVSHYLKGFAAVLYRRDKDSGEVKEVLQEGFSNEDQYVPSKIDLEKRFGADKFQLVRDRVDLPATADA